MAKYVDNQKLQQEIVLYQQAIKEALANGKPEPRANDFIGKSIWDIAHRFATKRNWVGYTNLWKEEMIHDGIENCIRYGLKKYDAEKYNSPLNYFTKIIQQSFVRRIEREKKEQVTRLKSKLDNEQIILLADNSYKLADNETADRLIREFEEKQVKAKLKKNAKKGVELFMD